MSDEASSATLSFTFHRRPDPKPRPADADLSFGKIFTDHMAVIDWAASRGWHDPRVIPYAPLVLDPAAAVLHYAQELFDGLKAFRGVDDRVRLFRVDRHCRRMSEGAARLCMPKIPPELMQRGIVELVKADRAWIPSAPGTALYIRPTLIATEPFLGVRPSRNYLFFIIASPVSGYHGTSLDPAKIYIEDSYVRAAPGGLGGVKAGANYVASLLAAEEAKAKGFDQVLWTDAAEHHWLEEVGTMNLMVRIGDEMITPPLAGSILGGITRESVIALLREWGIPVSERRISVEEIVQAHASGQLREVFGCGTAAVITPVGVLGWKDRRLEIGGGAAGEIARRLFDTITGLQYGRTSDSRGWTTIVES